MDPWPFGVGEVVAYGKNNEIKFRWYGCKGYSDTGKFLKGWIDNNNDTYYANEKTSPNHTPYYETDMVVHLSDVYYHSFKLSNGGRIHPQLLHAIRNNEQIKLTKEAGKADELEANKTQMQGSGPRRSTRSKRKR